MVGHADDELLNNRNDIPHSAVFLLAPILVPVIISIHITEGALLVERTFLKT